MKPDAKMKRVFPALALKSGSNLLPYNGTTPPRLVAIAADSYTFLTLQRHSYREGLPSRDRRVTTRPVDIVD